MRFSVVGLQLSVRACVGPPRAWRVAFVAS